MMVKKGHNIDALMIDKVHYNISERFPKVTRFKAVPALMCDLHL